MEQLPVIDLTAPRDEMVQAVTTACREWGFFQVVQHGIPDETFAAFDNAMRAFFALPDQVKRNLKRHEGNPRGWFDDELTKQTRDWKECVDIGRDKVSDIDGQNQWPDEETCPGFRAAVQAYFDECTKLSYRLLAICALGLGLSADFFEKSGLASVARDTDTSFIRLNHYPVCRDPVSSSHGFDEPKEGEGHLGINKHSDAGCITILRQYPDEPASLQVYHCGEWHRVHPVAGALTINIGDMMQVWSNDLYSAPLHRVLASSDAVRYSAPYFFNPPYEARIQPLPCTGSPRYSPFTWGEFRRRRFEGDFADYGAEVQIRDWAIPPPRQARL